MELALCDTRSVNPVLKFVPICDGIVTANVGGNVFQVELVPVVCWSDDEEAKVFEADVTVSFPSGLTIVLLE